MDNNIREKLVELLCDATTYTNNKWRKMIINVDHLIANGVTVQEWRPASNPPKEDGRYFVARYDRVTKTPFTDILWFESGQWWNKLHGGNFAVTHWMPMPPLPKGE